MISPRLTRSHLVLASGLILSGCMCRSPTNRLARERTGDGACDQMCAAETGIGVSGCAVGDKGGEGTEAVAHRIVRATCDLSHRSPSAGLRTKSRSASQQPQAADVAEGLEIVIVRQNLDVALERDGGD